YDNNDFAGALDAYRKYLVLSPADAEILNDTANCHFQLQDYQNAEEIYHKALLANENLNIIYRNLGLTKLHLGKPKEALVLLEKYIEIAPEDTDIELAVGTIYFQMAKYAEAILHLEKYLSAQPKSIEGLFDISECYYHLGYSESAVIGYNQILRLNPDYQPAQKRLEEIKTASVPA
ncbi:MAG: tetratricopeptide repeat protein, partial [candidate division Zixibacteria bacterium]|nr:tetratricopeptide repeat protein [candidate division Zixibacteria bacterium]